MLGSSKFPRFSVIIDTPADAPAHSLDGELRPALARISARISALVPRVPEGLDRDATRRKAREELAATGLEGEEIDRLADALVGLGTVRRAPTGSPTPAR